MPLELSQLPAEPYFIPPFEPVLAGVDYLNLRQVNLNLMAECIPGTNNATKLVRGFSIIAWVYWVYPRLLKELGREDAESHELIHFREKVESLLVWGHQLAGISGLPGISSKPPEGHDGRVDLTFKAWKRSRVNTSLEAAVQYGPALLDLGGLGIIHKIDHGIYTCTTIGKSLGEALDQQLKHSPHYEFLTNLNELKGTEEQAEELLPCWRIDETSSAEAEAFRKILWNTEHQSETSLRGRRSAMIELLLDLLRTSDHPLSVDEIRTKLAVPSLWTTRDIPTNQLRQSRSWLFLQLRQLQRLALESLMSWLEKQLISGGHQTPDKIVLRAWTIFNKEYELDSNVTTQDTLEYIGSPIEDLNSFQKLITDNPDWFSPWSLCSQLTDSVHAEDDTTLANAVYALLYLERCKPFLESEELLSRHINHGGSERISMAQWFRLVKQFRERPCIELLDWTIKTLIISQHFAVGTQRFDGKKIRLRMILDEDGLESLINKSPWHPGLTPDRLETLLSLMTSCNAIKKVGEDSYSAS